MKPVDKIKKIFDDWPKHAFDPVDFLDQAKSIMNRACAAGGEYDPRYHGKAQDACNAYGGIANTLLRSGFRSAAESLLIDAWDNFSEVQKEEKQRIYRAGLGVYLAKMYLALGDKGAAIRWALLTQADDMLGEHGKGGGVGKQMLLTILGMSEDELSSLNEIASSNLSRIRKVGEDDWSKPEAFAEDVVVKFTLASPEASHLSAAESSLEEFPLSRAYFSSLLRSVRVEHETAKAKGDVLEDLATYLFMLIPGWCPRRNIKDEYDTFENDLVIRNLNRSSNLTAEILGRHFLVECKNWEDRVGVSDVGYFLYRMRLTHVSFGVIFARSGITGTQETERFARSIIRKAFHEDGSICIVIREEDLETLLCKHSSFLSILLERAERVRFGKASKNAQASA